MRKRTSKGGMRKRTSKGGMRKRTSKAVCRRETLKKYQIRPSPPYRAAFCVGKKMKGNDGNMYVSRSDFEFAGARWVRV
jgi:hypothetical protein